VLVLCLAAAGFLVGSLPLWIFAVQQGPQQLVSEFFGSAVAVESGSWLERTAGHLINLGLLGSTAMFGLRPPWEVRWLAQPLIPLALAFWAGTIGYFGLCLQKGRQHRLVFGVLAGVVLSLCILFLTTPFGVDPSGRYFVPLAIPFALVGARMVLDLIRRWPVRLAVLGVILLFNSWGTLECAFANPPGISTQFNPETKVDMEGMKDLAAFLTINGETRGYTNYWVAYPLAFVSSEQIIFSPRLPYHLDFRYTSRDDRYFPYKEAVSSSQRVAYITTLHPELDQRIRERLGALNVEWKERKIGDFQIFYQLSRLVQPEQLGVGN
jgi:hypothetical protein